MKKLPLLLLLFSAKISFAQCNIQIGGTPTVTPSTTTGCNDGRIAFTARVHNEKSGPVFYASIFGTIKDKDGHVIKEMDRGANYWDDVNKIGYQDLYGNNLPGGTYVAHIYSNGPTSEACNLDYSFTVPVQGSCSVTAKGINVFQPSLQECNDGGFDVEVNANYCFSSYSATTTVNGTPLSIIGVSSGNKIIIPFENMPPGNYNVDIQTFPGCNGEEFKQTSTSVNLQAQYNCGLQLTGQAQNNGTIQSCSQGIIFGTVTPGDERNSSCINEYILQWDGPSTGFKYMPKDAGPQGFSISNLPSGVYTLKASGSDFFCYTPDVKISIKSCPKPSGMTFTPRKRSVIINVPNSCGTLIAKYSQNGKTKTVEGSGSTITLTGLSEGTTYSVSVINQCAEGIRASGNISVTTNPSTFSTESNIKSNMIVNSLKVYPNPASDKVTVQFTQEKVGKYTLQITDIAGQVLRKEEKFYSNKINSVEVDLSSLTPGLYFLSIIDGNSKQTVKITKQ